jgi:hypothetical protein
MVRHMGQQLAILEPDAPRTGRPRVGADGLAIPGRGTPRRKRTPATSLMLPERERDVLEQLAEMAGVTYAVVWRRALRCYAREQGLDVDYLGEVGPTADAERA